MKQREIFAVKLELSNTNEVAGGATRKTHLLVQLAISQQNPTQHGINP
jgi:hypothetical protein